MASPVSSQTRAELETNLLRFLCDAQSEITSRRRVFSIIESYAWSTPDFAIFFDGIRDLFERDPKHILANLPAQLTRRGFPDMPCEILAAPPTLSSASALALAKKLLRLSKAKR